MESKSQAKASNTDTAQRYVYLPSYFKHTYDQIKAILTAFLTQENLVTGHFLYALENIIKINGLYPHPKIDFSPLKVYFDSLSPVECDHVLNNLIKFIIEQALLLEQAFPEQKLQILTANIKGSVILSDQQVLILISNQFLCTFPNLENQKDFKAVQMPRDHCFYQILTYDEKKSKKDKNSVNQLQLTKIQFMMNYFQQEMNRHQSMTDKIDSDFITIERVVTPQSQYEKLNKSFWQGNQTQMIDNVIIDDASLMEDQNDCSIADFANQFIGGGCIRMGAVQEEILFVIFPQLYVSTLLCAKMEPNECLLLLNFKRYSNYKGYSNSLQYAGPFDKDQRRDFVAMDAVNYSRKQSTQFEIQNILRDINKVYTAFGLSENCKHQVISTGKWGCGAFSADPETKFLMQWMAAVVQNKQIIFNTFHDAKFAEKCKQQIANLKGKTIGEIFVMLQEKGKAQKSSKEEKKTFMKKK